MLVAGDGRIGTIGGGQLEYMAIDAARAMLARGGDAETLDMPLGPEIGQCCGGRTPLAVAPARPRLGAPARRRPRRTAAAPEGA